MLGLRLFIVVLIGSSGLSGLAAPLLARNNALETPSRDATENTLHIDNIISKGGDLHSGYTVSKKRGLSTGAPVLPGEVWARFIEMPATEQIESVNQAKQDMDQAESALTAEPGNAAALQKFNNAKESYDAVSKHLAEEDTRAFGSIENMNKLLAQPEEYKTTYLKNLADDVGQAKTNFGTASARYIAAIKEAEPTGNKNPGSEKIKYTPQTKADREALLDASDIYRAKSDLYDRFLAKMGNPIPSTTVDKTDPAAADIHGTAPAAAIDPDTVPAAKSLIQRVIDWFAERLK